MKSFAIMLTALSMLAFGWPASAEENLQTSRSAGKLKQDQSIDLKQVLQQSEITVRARPAAPENYDASATAARDAVIANRHDQLFEVYDADVVLISDLDADGFHHALKVIFDVDVSYDSATVYAKLYLSRQGSHWSQYYTTNLFQIHGDSVDDVYEVETELLGGYDPGYYSVLVEIYSLDHAFMVASEVLDYGYLGKDLPIEDLDWDDPYYQDHGEFGVVIGAGSMSALLIFFLIVQVVIAARATLALTPCKKSDDNYKKMLS